MPRIRTIKPEFYRHHELYLTEKESKLPIRIAFSGLWLCADKEGRFKWKPTELKLDILPYDELDFNDVLNILVEKGFIIKYTVEKKDYGVIPTFKEHQRITGTEKQYESKIPPFNGNAVESHNASIEAQRGDDGFPIKSQQVDNQTAFQSVSKETLCWEGKEKKERIEGKGKEKKEGLFIKKEEEPVLWSMEKKSFLQGGDWIYKFCSEKRIDLKVFDEMAADFISDIELREDFKTAKELRSHFTNLFNKNKREGKGNGAFTKNKNKGFIEVPKGVNYDNLSMRI